MKEAERLEDVSNMTRNEVVPYYIKIILSDDYLTGMKEAARVNKLILTKWKMSGLIYIKEKAWKRAEAIHALEQLKKQVQQHGIQS